MNADGCRSPAVICIVLGLLIVSMAAEGAPRIGPPPKRLRLDPFYQKHVSARGLPVVGSAKVGDAALLKARELILRMTGKRPDVVAELKRRRVRIAIMAESEVTLDIPEHRDLNTAFPKTDWNQRARGLGATDERPACSGAEENLLALPGDRYHGESILIHEFAHTMHGMGVRHLDPGLWRAIKRAYSEAMKAGLWKDTYAATNVGEYWAEGVQSWFDANREAHPPNGVHNHVNTREELKEYDPALARLIHRVYPDGRWRFSYAGLRERRGRTSKTE